MKVTINKEVFTSFHPKLRIGLIKIDDIENPVDEKSAHLIEDVEKLIRLTFHKDSVKSHKYVSPWGASQEKFGNVAKHYHTSVERLLREVLRGKDVSSNFTVENIVNYISLKYIVPGSVDDFGKIDKGLTFAISKGKEKVSSLRSLKRGALYYKDTKSPLGTKLDYWKNKRTKVEAVTQSALIHFEFLPPVTIAKSKEILDETKALLSAFCRGKIKSVVLDPKKNSVVI